MLAWEGVATGLLVSQILAVQPPSAQGVELQLLLGQGRGGSSNKTSNRSCRVFLSSLLDGALFSETIKSGVVAGVS